MNKANGHAIPMRLAAMLFSIIVTSGYPTRCMPASPPVAHDTFFPRSKTDAMRLLRSYYSDDNIERVFNNADTSDDRRRIIADLFYLSVMITPSFLVSMGTIVGSGGKVFDDDQRRNSEGRANGC